MSSCSFKFFIFIFLSQGRTLNINGDIFYSPNSTRMVSLPDPADEGRNIFYPIPQNGRFNWWGLDIANFSRPRWFVRAVQYAAFFPMEPIFTDFIFAPLLRATPRYIRADGDAYIFDPRERDDWLLLDNCIYQVACILKVHYEAPMVYPNNPWTFGYLRSHPTFGAVRTCLRKSHDWFVVWMGVISYLVAHAETVASSNDSGESHVHEWLGVLQDEGHKCGLSAAWLDSLMLSTACSFSSKTPRAGVFLYMPPVTHQPAPEWYVKYHVPVWYPWSSSQTSNKKLNRYAPPTHLLQEMHTFIMRSPTVVHPSVDENLPAQDLIARRSPSLPSERARYGMTPRMLAFFNARVASNTQKSLNEKSKDTQARLSRTACPPPVSKNGKARLFVWRSEHNGEYTREEIASSLREDTMAMYSSLQTRYDPFTNQYDCCDDWGPCPEGSDDGSEMGNNTPYPGDESAADEVYSRLDHIDRNLQFEEAHWEPQAPPIHSDVPADTSIQEEGVVVLETQLRKSMWLWYGYMPAAPVAAGPTVPQRERIQWCIAFGWPYAKVKHCDDLFFARPYVTAAVQFLRRLSTDPTCVDPQEWDLNRYCPVSVVNRPRFSMIKTWKSTNDETLYVFDLGSSRTVRWNIALKTASEAIVVCRLTDNLDEREIAQLLVDYGIPFHTLQPSSSILRAGNVYRPSMDIPIRSKGYIFLVEDYVSYRNRCNSILRHPRGRAALMSGTYVGRVAQNVVPLEWVFDGPSGWSLAAEDMIIVHDESGNEYIDDRLTENEKLVYTGCYRGRTGKQTH